jgi:hypothetical protein
VSRGFCAFVSGAWSGCRHAKEDRWLDHASSGHRTGACDRDCDQDTSERAERGATGRDGITSSAEASMGVSDRPGRVATARGMLITQR